MGMSQEEKSEFSTTAESRLYLWVGLVIDPEDLMVSLKQKPTSGKVISRR